MKHRTAILSRSEWTPSALPGVVGDWSSDGSPLDVSGDGESVGSVGGMAPCPVALTEATAGNKPILKLGLGPTGRNILRFDKANSQRLSEATIAAALSGAGVPFTITNVCKVTGATGTQAAWGFGHSTNPQKGYFASARDYSGVSHNYYHNNDSNSNTAVDEQQLEVDAYWHVETVVFDGTNISIYIDGVLQDVAKAWGSAATTINRFSIGALYTTGLVQWYASMDWHRTIINNVALSVGDVIALHAYLAGKYLGWALNEYIALDEFLTTDDNPITSPRIGEPGRGVWTVADSGNKLSIAGGKLVVGGGSGYTAPHLYQPKRVGATGLMMHVGAYLPGPNVASGFWAGLLGNITTSVGGSCVAASNYVRGANNGPAIYDSRFWCPTTDTWTDPKYFEMAVVKMATGVACLVRRPGNAQWQLNWVDYTASIAACYPRMMSAGKILSVDSARVQLAGVTVPTPVASVSSLDAGGTLAGHVDGLVFASFVAETGVTKEVRVRYTDADNCIVIRCNQGASTIKVISRVAGAETELQSAAQTWTNGTTYTLGVVMDWQRIVVHVNGANVGAGVLSTVFLGTVPTSSTLVSVSHDSTNVRTWPKYVSVGGPPNAKTRGIYAVGDSITRGEVDTADAGGTDYSPYPLDQCGWPQRLCALLGGEEVPKRYAVGGHTVALQLADIATSLNDFLGTPSDVVTMHGSNEMSSMPTKAQFKSDYLALIAAWHRKWPSATVWIMKPWRRGKAAEAALIAAWIDEIIADASCSAFTRAGADLRSFIPGSDDGTTNTFDGTHPNRQGHILMAAAQAALML